MGYWIDAHSHHRHHHPHHHPHQWPVTMKARLPQVEVISRGLNIVLVTRCNVAPRIFKVKTSLSDVTNELQKSILFGALSHYMPAPLPNSPIKLNLPEMVDRAEKSGSRSKLCTMELWTFALFTIISSFYSVLALPPKGVCLLEGDEGPCRANIERYYYNTITQKCEVFYYGGCQGNANNFRSYQECHKTCYKIPKVPPICRVPKDEGPCRALLPSYFFNMTTMQCEPFSYGGCQGNSNRFQSLVSCMEYCSPKRFPPVLCREPLDKGKCSASITRYYYNAATKMCEEFVYSGCGGTNNNFVSLQGCMDVCGKGWKKHTGQGKFKRMRQYRKPMPSLQV